MMGEMWYRIMVSIGRWMGMVQMGMDELDMYSRPGNGHGHGHDF
jgi:hypothetical protein